MSDTPNPATTPSDRCATCERDGCEGTHMIDPYAHMLVGRRVSPSEGSAPDTPTPYQWAVIDKNGVPWEYADTEEGAKRVVGTYSHMFAVDGPFSYFPVYRAHLIVPPSAPDTKPDERLAEIRERLAGISATPWEHVGYFHALRQIAGCGQTDDNVPHYVVRREGSSLKPNGARADAEFIAHAPEDIAYLLSRVSSSPPEGEDTQRLEDQ